MFDPEYTISLHFNGDATLTQADVDQLSDWIVQSPENAAKFIQASFMHRAVHDSLNGIDMTKNVLLDLNEATNSGYDVVMDSSISLKGVDIDRVLAEDKEPAVSLDSNIMQALQELAECERTAPTVIVEKPVVERELIRNIDNSNFKIFAGSVNKLSLCAAVFFAACLIGLLGFAYFTPTPVDPPVVAQLIDQIDAVWDEEMQLPDYDDCMRQSTYRLTAGFASIKFNDGANVTIEAPAEWSLQSSGNMELFSGQIYAVVPEQARGFSITAGNTKIIDRGTEFGIKVDKHKTTQLHVTRGRTLLFYGSKDGKKFEKEVDHGSARQVGSNGKLTIIPLALKKFARNINSSTNQITRILECNVLIAEYGFQTPDATEFATGFIDIDKTGYAFNYPDEFIQSPWTFTDESGIACPPSSWECDSISPDPAGDQFAFLQGAATISQEMTGLAIGATCEISFFEATRTAGRSTPYYDGTNDLSVILDEGLPTEIVIYNNPSVANLKWGYRTTDQFVAAKTSYTVTFKATSPRSGDSTTIIDGVQLTTHTGNKLKDL
jgi:hypothetical protein